MKDFEKSLGLGSIKPTKEQKIYLRKSFEAQILTAALLRGMISPDRYVEVFNRRVGMQPKSSNKY